MPPSYIGDAGPIRRVAVCVATYRRPAQLKRLLDSLAAQVTNVEWRLIVVDNDADASGRQSVQRSDLLARTTYVVEPRPGIAATRNRCLSLREAEDDALVFVDDDEYVVPSWLDDLVSCANRYCAGVVAGPVVSVYPKETPWWIRRGRFLDRLVRRTGVSHGSPYTGNVLICAPVLAGPGCRFDERRFNLTGGEDTEFFRRTLCRGRVPWVWCSDALAYEDLPAGRLRFSTISRRRVRDGNVLGRILLAERTRGLVLLEGLLRCGAGLPSALLCFALCPRYCGVAFGLGMQGVGMVLASFGRVVIGYQRDDSNHLRVP